MWIHPKKLEIHKSSVKMSHLNMNNINIVSGIPVTKPDYKE